MSATLPLSLLLAVAAAESPPTTNVAKLPVEAAVGFAAGPLRHQVRVLDVLARWERAAAELPPLTAAERDRIVRRHRGTLSAHEAAVAAGFRGPISMRELRRNFRWSGMRTSRDGDLLTATPHDAVERLFYRQFELRLNAETFLPNAMRFQHADDRPTTTVPIPIEIAAENQQPGAAAIRLVKAETRMPIAAPRPLPRGSSKSDKRLQAILQRWQQSVARDGVVETGYSMYQYDFAFEIEKRSVGTFRFEHPNRFSFQLHPATIEPGTKSSKMSSRGKRFVLKAGKRESISCDGKKVIQESADKTIEFGILDPSDPTRLKTWFSFRKDVPIRDAINEMVSFASPTIADFESRYRWKFEMETAGVVWLSALPKTKSAAVSARSLKVILNRENYRPVAVQRIDPAGRETVYVFHKWIAVPRAE
jgi:hypothetical protein